MSFPEYKNAVVDCSKPPNLDSIRGKTVIITGGAGGQGEAGVRAFIHAGAFVTFGDNNEEAGKKLAAELGDNAKFYKCDVTSWEDQLAMFKGALASSPSKSIDVVIANAGITGPDHIFYGEDPDQTEPVKPTFKTLDVNLTGVLYTMKLARFYFLRSPTGSDRDRCFMVMSSAVGYVDNPGGPTYMASKWAVRGLMRCLRRTTVVDGIRAISVAPWYMATGLLTPAVTDYVRSTGVTFALPEDTAACWLKVASDRSINGRGFAVVPKTADAPLGYYDMDCDDYPEGSRIQEQQMGILRTSHRVKVSAKSQ